MCGIFGYYLQAGKVSPGRRLLLAATLARLNDDRGKDSWGLARLDGGRIRIDRGLGHFADEVQRLSGTTAFLGHTRYATHGEKTVENAHPFEVGEIVGAHNGIIYNNEEMNRTHNRKHEVDSVHLFSHLSEGKDFGDLEGYGSIEWVNRHNPREVFLCRMKGGELCIAGIGDYKKGPIGIVWSSSKKHLEEAMEAAGIDEYYTYKTDEGKVFKVSGGNLYETDRTCHLSKKERVSYFGRGNYYGSGFRGRESWMWDDDDEEWNKILASYRDDGKKTIVLDGRESGDVFIDEDGSAVGLGGEDGEDTPSGWKRELFLDWKDRRDRDRTLQEELEDEERRLGARQAG